MRRLNVAPESAQSGASGAKWGALAQVDPAHDERAVPVGVAVLFRLGQYVETERAGVRLLAGDTDPERVTDAAWLVAYAMLRTERDAEAIAQVTQGLARPGLSESQRARSARSRAGIVREVYSRPRGTQNASVG